MTGGSRERKSPFKIFVAKFLDALRSQGEQKVRAIDNPTDPERQDLWEDYILDVTHRYVTIDGNRRWRPTTAPTEHFLKQIVRSPEEEVAALQDRIFPYHGASCFWPYLLSAELRPTRNAAEIHGFGSGKILCPSWLSSITLEKFEIKIAQLFNNENKVMVDTSLKDLCRIFDLNSSALIAYLNLSLVDGSNFRARLAQFHFIFFKQVAAVIGDNSYALVSIGMAHELTRQLVNHEDDMDEKGCSPANSHEESNSDEPLGEDEEVISGLASIVVSEFDNYDVRIELESLATEKCTTGDLNLVIEHHCALQAHLLKSLSKKNSTKKIICPFHGDTVTDQLCCVLVGEANELRKTLRNSDGRFKLLDVSRRNSSRSIRFIGPPPHFLSR